jgi:hypothetical protein
MLNKTGITFASTTIPTFSHRGRSPLKPEVFIYLKEIMHGVKSEAFPPRGNVKGG